MLSFFDKNAIQLKSRSSATSGRSSTQSLKFNCGAVLASDVLDDFDGCAENFVPAYDLVQRRFEIGGSTGRKIIRNARCLCR